MFLLVLLCPTQALDLPGDICLLTRMTATARQWWHIYVDASVQVAEEEMTAGEVVGSCQQRPWHAAAFDDGGGMWWHAAVCSCVALPPCGCKTGSGGG
jgi:hypothetical protein